MDKQLYPIHESVRDRIHPEYKEYYNTHLIDKPPTHLVPIEKSRASGNFIPGSGPLVPVGRTEEHCVKRVASFGPDVLVRCFIPEGDKPADGWPVLIYFHGGGWVLGNLDTENSIITNICARAEAVVVSVDYRLAPENRFPAAVEDSWEGVLWTIGPGKDLLQLDMNKVAIGGSSAGGNLAAVMCQRAVAHGSPHFKIQMLSVPVTDNAAQVSNNSAWREKEHAPALPVDKMLWYRHHYLPAQEDWSNPEASPLLWPGDWSKMPPAVLAIAELDILSLDGERYAEKLKNAGVPVDVQIYQGQPHPFISMDGVLEDGRRAITLFCEAMKKTMS